MQTVYIDVEESEFDLFFKNNLLEPLTHFICRNSLLREERHSDTFPN